MDRTKVKTIIQEAINKELKEIFGFGRKSTEKLDPDHSESEPVEAFSMEKLKQLKTSKDIRRYAQMTLPELGRGQARVAYAVNDDKVLKVALSDNKAYQNKNEVQNTKCIGSQYAVQVLDFDPKFFSWILEEKINSVSKAVLVNKINSLMGFEGTEFEFVGGIEIQDFFADMQNLLARRSDNQKHQQRHDLLMKGNRWYVGLLGKLQSCKVASWDFHYKNWGIRPGTGELVLLDVGFNPAESSPEEEFFKEELGILR